MDNSAPTFAPGSEFAGYRIESVAGRGGMGIVYRATQLALGRPVALKLLTAQLAADDGFRERFRREWETAAAIDHPNVIPLYEAGECDGTLFIAMRFVEGVDLAYMSADGPMAAARAVPLVAQIAAALDAAHARGLVHRDVKPANVLVGEGDHAYLSDFGLSREASQTRLTRTGLFVGSTDYAAPEQVRGEATDARTDVYALGCVLFQLLTGSVPFARSGDMAKMYAHITEPPPLVSDTQPKLPEFDAIVERAMAKDPDDRHQSAGELAHEALAAIRPSSAAHHVPAPPPAPVAPAGWDTAPVGLAALTPSAATPSGSVSGWAAGPAGTATGAAVAATPAGLGGPAGGSSPLADIPGSRAATPVAASPPPSGATAAPTGFATPARAAGAPRVAAPASTPDSFAPATSAHVASGAPRVRRPRVGRPRECAGREWGRREWSAASGRAASAPAAPAGFAAPARAAAAPRVAAPAPAVPPSLAPASLAPAAPRPPRAALSRPLRRASLLGPSGGASR